ncbi:MAG: glycosyltransferase family 4 protein [Nanoarchaeota archaeon]|nr:glycosyltransferase family 4 protein [Nanoarchaeota archaeon]
MNILIITEYFPTSDKKITGGVEARAYNVAKVLAKKNNVVVCTSLQSGQKSSENIDEIRILRFCPSFEYSSTKSLAKRASWGIAMALRLPKIMKKHNIDVVDSQNYFSYPCSLVAKMLRKKSFATYHEVWLGSWAKNTGSWLGFLGEFAERIVLFKFAILGVKIISVSDFTKKRLVDAGINHKKIAVIPNGIDLKKYGTKKETKKKDSNSICYVGRLVEHKGVNDLIHAVSLVKKKIFDVNLTIVGDGPEKKTLEILTKKLRLENSVNFRGYVKDHEEVVDIIRSSEVLIHPGTVEGFGIILIEAMACQTPYVASSIDVFREVTEDGKGGLLFKVMNSEDLAEKIIKLLKDKKLYSKKQKEGKELVKKYYWKEIVEKIEEEYVK